jgi:hypothetical protein
MDASLMTRMKELEAENNRLKKMYADVQLQHDVVKEEVAKMYGLLLLCKDCFVTWDGCPNVSGLLQVGCYCSQAMMRCARGVPE